MSEFRRRIFEALELIVDREGQLEYQRKVPYVDVPTELFNQWDDVYVPDGAEFRSQFLSDELEALARFASLLDAVAAETPQRLPPIEEFQKTEAWFRLFEGATATLAKMSRWWREGEGGIPK